MLPYYVICCRRSLIPSIYCALTSEFLVRTGVQFILGKPNIVPSDVLQLLKYEATVELELAGSMGCLHPRVHICVWPGKSKSQTVCMLLSLVPMSMQEGYSI